MSVTFRLLPDHVRDADAGDLESFLSGAENALSPQTAFLDAAGRGDPVNPATCPPGWLPWLAFLLGADITGLTDESARWYLTHPDRAAHGTDRGIKAAVGATLTGSRAVTIEHTGTWTTTLTVATAEVVDIALTLAVAQRSCHAGVDVTVTPDTPVTLAGLNAGYASLAAIYATGKTLDQLRFG
jgi:hypothetical protein